MVGVGLPLDRLAAPSDDHAGPVRWLSAFNFDSRGEVHSPSDSTKDALSVVNQPNELAQVCFPPQVNHAIQLWVIVSTLADLHELYLPAKVIDYLLVAFGFPPLYRDVKLPP